MAFVRKVPCLTIYFFSMHVLHVARLFENGNFSAKNTMNPEIDHVGKFDWKKVYFNQIAFFLSDTHPLYLRNGNLGYFYIASKEIK